MKRKRTYILLIAVLLSIDLSAQEGVRGVAGKGGLPYFSSRGTLELTALDIEIKVLKRDQRNRNWVLWEVREPDRRDVFLGRLEDGKITHRRRISRDFPGMNHSPDLDISPAGQPWVTWVNIHKREYRLCVSDLHGGRIWELSPGDPRPMFTPKLLIDMGGGIWVFWVGPETGLDGIHYRTYRPDRWSPAYSITGGSSAPQFHPSVALNEMGTPSLAWTSFDGSDYEVYYTAWTGTGWRESENVSRDHGASDGQPSLVFLNGLGGPAVAWTRTDAQGTDIYFSLREPHGWLPGANVSRDTARSHSPTLVASGGRMGLSWEQGGRVRLKRLELPLDPIPEEPPPLLHTSSQSGHLDTEKFVGFGDSITFGSMDGPEMGVGYVPRLQTLLRDDFSDPLVVNRGIPGEPTWEGVSRINSVITLELGLYLLLKEGTNDITDFDYSSATTAFNLEQMVLSCKAFGVIPLISSVIPRARGRWVDPYIQRTEALNIKIEELARTQSIVRVDNYGAFMAYPPGSGGHEALISGDDLHPNDGGYQIMAETWETGILGIPLPPVNIAAVKSDRNRTITLTWESNPKILDPSNLQFFRIYRQVKEITDLRPVAVVPASMFNYEDRNIQLGTDYRYALTSLNKQGVESQLSAPVDPVRGEPLPPINVSTETVSNSSFLYTEYINIVGWQENPGNEGQFTVTRYKIYRKLASESDVFFRLLGEVTAGQSTLEYWDRGLQSQEEATQYTYGVSAQDGDGNESLINTDQGPVETVSSTDTRARSRNRAPASRRTRRAPQ